MAIRKDAARAPGPGWIALAVLSAAIAIPSYRYLAGLGPVGPNVAANHNLHPWIFAHAAGAATALLVGPAQLLAGLRARRPRLHRWSGRLYVAGCALGGLAGAALALGVSTGPIASAGFLALALAWLAATGLGFAAARGRRIEAHRRWMIRSFALTFAAVTLRLYLPFAFLPHVDFARAYQAISWLCWVPNLAVAELLLRRRSARPGP